MKPGFSIEIEVCFLALKRRMAPDGAGWRRMAPEALEALRGGAQRAGVGLLDYCQALLLTASRRMVESHREGAV